MDAHIFIALVGALINMALSVTIPCLVKKTDQPFLMQVKKVFDTNREVILTSSLIIAVTIYLSLKIAPNLQSSFSGITGLNINSSDISDFTHEPIIITHNLQPQLKNLIRLMSQ
jgi:hypothetical protein